MNVKSILSGIVILLLVVVGIFYLIHINSAGDLASSFHPQQVKVFQINDTENKPIDVQATTLPQFALKLADQKFQNLWTAHAAEQRDLVKSNVESTTSNDNVSTEAQFDGTKKQLTLTPQMMNSFKPGLYRLNVVVKTYSGKDITVTQDFRWGVLAINTNKAIYQPGDTVKIGMAVLDDMGRTKCIAKDTIVFGTAKVWLTIKSPTGKIEKLSTDDGTIKGSKSCADRSISNDADFLTQTKAAEIGKYTVHMEAENILGKRSSDSFFNVQQSPAAFDVERTSYPTRIYPRANYPVSITVKANQDYFGSVYDIVPNNFTITDISGKGELKTSKNLQTINWQVDWKQGQTYTLSYTIRFPQITPEFYLVGPLTIGDFKEGNEWQIASDSLFSLIQEAHHLTSSGTANTATFGSGATANHLLVMICYRTVSGTFNIPSGWTRAFRTSGTTSTTPKVYMFYRLATSGLTTGTCTASTSTGEIATQLLEYSGNATSGYFDRAGTALSASTTCNSGTHQATLATTPPTNPDELAISAFVSTNNAITVTAHNAITGVSSSGFDDTLTNGFAGTTGYFDSGWGEAINNPATSQRDIATYSANATKCSADQAFFNSTITISEGSYQFFDNVDSFTPVTTFNNGGTAENTPITLTDPNKPFRLRLLLDVDSASGNTLGLQSGDFNLFYAPLPGTSNCADVVTWNPIATAVASESASMTPIAYFPNNSTNGSGFNIIATGSDPTDTGYTNVPESYYEDDSTSNGPGGVSGSNPGDITNDQAAIANNQAGLWDFSLIDTTDGSDHGTYCLEVANPDGSPLNAYLNYPKVTLYKAEVIIHGGTTLNGGTKIF